MSELADPPVWKLPYPRHTRRALEIRFFPKKSLNASIISSPLILSYFREIRFLMLRLEGITNTNASGRSKRTTRGIGIAEYANTHVDIGQT